MNNSSSNSAQNFSFKPSSGFATASSGSTPVFGNTPAFGAVPAASSAIAAATPTFGLRKPEIASAASFSFKRCLRWPLLYKGVYSNRFPVASLQSSACFLVSIEHSYISVTGALKISYKNFRVKEDQLT